MSNTIQNNDSKDDDILYHTGVLGMKWGIRRYSNKDGSLTSAGKKRQNKEESKNVKKTSVSSKPASVKKEIDMTDDELRQKINRLQMEKQYKDFLPKPETKQVSKSRQFIVDVLTNSGKSAATIVVTAAFTYAGKQFVKKTLGDNVYKEMFPKDKEKKKD